MISIFFLFLHKMVAGIMDSHCLPSSSSGSRSVSSSAMSSLSSGEISFTLSLLYSGEVKCFRHSVSNK